jgi:hypothetical protein
MAARKRRYTAHKSGRPSRPAKYGSKQHHAKISRGVRQFHRTGRKGGGKWMQKLHLHKGALHRALGVPEGKPIPAGKLNQAAKSSDEHIARMARLAEVFKRSRHTRSSYKKAAATRRKHSPRR